MKKVSKIQQRYLRLMTNNYELSYEELLDLLRFLRTNTVLKFSNDWGIQIPKWNVTWHEWYTAVSKHQYNTRHYNLFVTDLPNTDRCDRNSIPYRTNHIWNLLPPQIKNSANLDSFKLKIKQWRCVEYPCIFCKNIYQI